MSSTGARLAAYFSAAFAAIIVSYASGAAIIFQVTRVFHATDTQTASWFTSLSITCGLLTLILSRKYKIPIMIAWCTPCAAMLVGLEGYTLPAAVGAFMFAAVLILITTVTGIFSRLAALVPTELAAAMLAGVLLNFGSRVFLVMQSQTALVALMLIAYLISRIYLARYSIIIMLLVGMSYAIFNGTLQPGILQWHNPTLEWVSPEWNSRAIAGIGLPLFVAVLATQHVPGIAVMRSHGYNPPIGPVIGSTAGLTLLAAPFGAFMINLAAISSSLTMGHDVDPNPNERYKANIILAGLYFLLAIAGGTAAAIFTALPVELTAALAGITIFATLQNNLVLAGSSKNLREASLITLLTSASGMTLLDIGSPFWGLVFGYLVFRLNRRRKST